MVKSECSKVGIVLRGLLLVLLALAAGCTANAPEASPAPVVFDAPREEIGSALRLPFEQADHFGAAVDIEGGVVVSGAPRWGYPGEGAGAVYVFRRSGVGEWQLEASLSASDRDDGLQYDQHFGEAVALQGMLIAVGAPGYDDPEAGDNTGAAYIFEYDGSSWVETARLNPSQKTVGARMGSVIALDGDLLALSGSPYAGSVATFRREPGGWHELEPVEVPPAPDGERPYVLLDLYGDTLAVSTVVWPEPKDGMDEETLIKLMRRAGVVTLYARDGDGWKKTFESEPQEAALFRVRDAAPFGLPVALGGEAGEARWLAVGKPGFTGSGREQGSVLIYERAGGSWTPQAELALGPAEPPEGALPFFGKDPGATFFGAFVGFEGDRLSVVSMFANAVYVFERQGNSWVYRVRATPGVEGFDDFMRRTAAIDGDSLLMGSPGDLGGGIVFVFEMGR